MQREDMKDLLWFLAVASERNFTKAAAKLGTSQSTLSHTIKQLEARLGVRSADPHDAQRRADGRGRTAVSVAPAAL